MLRQSCKNLVVLAQFNSKRRYHERVIELFNNPRNIGSFNKDDADVGTGLVGSPACGDVMKFQIKVDKITGKIIEAVNRTFGCAASIAAASRVAEMVKGMTLEEALSIKNKDVAKYLSLPPVKLHCSMLAEDGIKAAAKDYMAKQSAEKVGSEAAPK